MVVICGVSHNVRTRSDPTSSHHVRNRHSEQSLATATFHKYVLRTKIALKNPTQAQRRGADSPHDEWVFLDNTVVEVHKMDAFTSRVRLLVFSAMAVPK